MIFYPNAKINLGLSIIAKREDGYHALESILLPIDFVDILEITKSTDFEFLQTGLAVDGDLDSNLCVKAFHLMQSKFEIGNVRIHLRKQIPMGAGLGGGSADATFVIKGINELFELKLSDTEMQKMASELGSDCAFFVRNCPQLAEGRGEVLSDIDLDLKGMYLKIINPGIHISTKEAFSNVHKSGQFGHLIQEIKQPKENWKSKIQNDFEVHLFKAHPELERIKEACYSEGAFYASMSGSGSTMFALYEKEPKFSFPEFPLEKVLEFKG